MATQQPADPRATITPDSFTVASDLLGLPLARPWRRLAAMLLDLLAVALLANAGGVFLGLAAAITLWRASASGTGGALRGSLRLGAAFLLFVAIVTAWGNLTDDDGSGTTVQVRDGSNFALEFADLAALPDLIALTTATDTGEVRDAARNVAARVRGPDAAARREAASELMSQVDDPGARAILRDAIAAAAEDARDDDEGPRGDSAIVAYADALQRSDTPALAMLRAPAVEALAGDSLDQLQRRAERLDTRSRRLADEVSDIEDRRSGFMGFLRSIADDLGIGFGWGALYFTAFLTLWRGQTPGKHLLGTRVIRLDGKPIGWWIAFERFGSYAASLSTGLLGFAQILWDRNRQGLHDKAVETVVIRDLPASIRAGGNWQPAGR